MGELPCTGRSSEGLNEVIALFPTGANTQIVYNLGTKRLHSYP